MSSRGDCRQRKTDKMTTSKKKTKNAISAPTTKARVAKRRAQAAPLKAEPATKAASANQPATAAHGGSKTGKILDLLKRPGGVTLKELAKIRGEPNDNDESSAEYQYTRAESAA
jgi:hypothetical protein